MSHDRFYLYKIFKEDTKVIISEKEIAELHGVTLEEVREYIQKDVQAKMIDWAPLTSTFYLRPRGFEYLYCIRIGKYNF